jgi:hypothetical protein
MAKMEMTTLGGGNVSVRSLLLLLLHISRVFFSFFQDACDVPCPCVEGGNDGLHGCWLCCLIGGWDGVARVGVGGMLGAVVRGYSFDTIEVLLRRIELRWWC